MRGARPQRPLDERQGQALCFKRFRDVLAQAVPQQSHERLSPCINSQALLPKRQRRAVAQKRTWRQFTQLRFADDQRQTGVATRHGVADPVTFGGVEEQHLVRFGYGLVMPKMPHIDAAIRKYQLRVGRALFRTLIRAAALAAHVPDRNGRRFQQSIERKTQTSIFFGG